MQHDITDRTDSISAVPVLMASGESYAVVLVTNEDGRSAVYGESQIRQMSDALAEVKARMAACLGTD